MPAFVREECISLLSTGLWPAPLPALQVRAELDYQELGSRNRAWLCECTELEVAHLVWAHPRGKEEGRQKGTTVLPCTTTQLSLVGAHTCTWSYREAK